MSADYRLESLSGFYKVGMVRLEFQFFVFMLVDETTPLVYDTLYVDWETSWYLTATDNGWDDQGYTAEWDFTDNLGEPHRWGDGTEILAYDLDGDGINDFNMGALSTTFDLFSQVNGDILAGIDPLGRGFAHMYDTAGHGTSCAGAAAGRDLAGGHRTPVPPPPRAEEGARDLCRAHEALALPPRHHGAPSAELDGFGARASGPNR